MALQHGTRLHHVPRFAMFFYLLQCIVAHGFGVLLRYLVGTDVSCLSLALFEMGPAAPPGEGF